MVNEFDKAGLTAAFRFGEAIQSKESPVQFECKVNQIIPLGTEGGAGNLILCEVVNSYRRSLDTNGSIDQHKIGVEIRWKLVFEIKSRFV
jgi:flavin reductase (DIM6/NTAB) family NADH-FMN oxidoreductase RutF